MGRRPTTVHVCRIEGCEKPRAGRHTLCAMHRARKYQHGTFDPPPWTRPGRKPVVLKPDEIEHAKRVAEKLLARVRTHKAVA